MTFLEQSNITLLGKSDLEIIGSTIILKNISLEPYDSLVNEFKCPKCNELVYKKEIYQCKNGDQLCKQCFQNQIDQFKQCDVCKVEVSSIEQLSICKFYVSSFLNKKIQCPFSLYSTYSITDECCSLNKDHEGCSEVIKIGELESHMEGCQKRFVPCQSSGCEQILRFNSLQEHIDACGFTIIKCQFCSIEVKRSEIESHYTVCPSIDIECYQCHSQVKRGSLQEHIRDFCFNTTIPCKYNQYGCESHFERYQMDHHLESVNHTKFITKLTEIQQEQIQLLQTKMDELIKFHETLSIQSICVGEYKDQNTFQGYWTLREYSTNDAFKSPLYKLGDIKFSFAALNNYFSIDIFDIKMNFKVKFTVINSNYEQSKKLFKKRENGFYPLRYLFPFLKSSYTEANGFIQEDKLDIKFSVHFYEDKSNSMFPFNKFQNNSSSTTNK